MSDDIKLKRPKDPSIINKNERSEIAYWSHKFGVTEDMLLHAIEMVGNLLVDVKRYLGK